MGYWLLLLLVIWPAGQVLGEHTAVQSHTCKSLHRCHWHLSVWQTVATGAEGMLVQLTQHTRRGAHIHLQGLAVRL